MSHTITFQGGPADGKVVKVEPHDMGRYVLIPVMWPRAIGPRNGEMWFERSVEMHRYSPLSGAYLGIEPPRDFPTPFPPIEVFYWWAHVKMLARRWWPQVNIERLTHERKLTVNVSIPAAKGRR